MCELLGMSSNRQATVNLSLMKLAEHGGFSGPHRDGWGVAYYEGLARISHQKRGWGAFEGGFCFGRWVAARCTGAGEVGFRTMAARRCCVRA
jgi:hypothetical protein